MKKIILILSLSLACIASAFTVQPIMLELHNCVYDSTDGRFYCNSNNPRTKRGEHKHGKEVIVEVGGSVVGFGYRNVDTDITYWLDGKEVKYLEHDHASGVKIGESKRKLKTNLLDITRGVVNSTHGND